MHTLRESIIVQHPVHHDPAISESRWVVCHQGADDVEESGKLITTLITALEPRIPRNQDTGQHAHMTITPVTVLHTGTQTDPHT